jgi:hypothetical protein
MRRGGITELLGISRSAMPPLPDTIDTHSTSRSQESMPGQRGIVANAIFKSTYPRGSEQPTATAFFMMVFILKSLKC